MKPIWFLFSIFFALTLMGVSPDAHADLSSIDDVLAATGSDPNAPDASMTVFQHIIGDHLKNPFTTLGAPDTLFGKLFLTLNLFVFLIGVIFASYGITAGIVQTAHEGQVLGRRMSAIWMPIRMVTGIAGLIPFFGGFSLSQAVMMLASLLGIGLANYGWKQVIDNFNEFSGMARPSIGDGTQSKSPLGLSYAVFSSELCRVAYEDYLASSNSDSIERLVAHQGGSGFSEAQAVMGYGKITNTNAMRTNDYCGRMEVKSTGLRSSWLPNKETVSFGFTVASVNYTPIATAIANGIHPAATILAQTNSTLARNWYAQWKAARIAGGPPPPINWKDIESSAAVFSISLAAKGNAAVPGPGVITDAAKDAMTRYGWFGAGAWYATLAEGQTALTEAFNTVEYNLIDPVNLLVDQKYDYPDAVSDPLNSYIKLMGARLSNGGKISDTLSEVWDSDLGDDGTGNVSVGQKIVREIIEHAGSTQGNSGGNTFNPIIMLKNTGDYAMTSVQAFVLGEAAMDLIPAMKAVKGMSAVTGALKKVATASASSGGSGSLVGMMSILMGAIFVVGAIMSLYIPFIPFIAWMGGLIQYVTIFFEGLVAAPIWAFAHLDADGEGMGQRAERGYIFLLNMLFRPFLMVLGFVLAAALLVVLGTFQAAMFIPAMSNVQGNSLTGLVSIVMLLGVFVIMNITMIHGVFNLITLIPDQVLGWVGNMSNTQLGKETEEKAHAMFINLGRGVAPALGGVAGRAAKPGKGSNSPGPSKDLVRGDPKMKK